MASLYSCWLITCLGKCGKMWAHTTLSYALEPLSHFIISWVTCSRLITFSLQSPPERALTDWVRTESYFIPLLLWTDRWYCHCLQGPRRVTFTFCDLKAPLRNQLPRPNYHRWGNGGTHTHTYRKKHCMTLTQTERACKTVTSRQSVIRPHKKKNTFPLRLLNSSLSSH